MRIAIAAWLTGIILLTTFARAQDAASPPDTLFPRGTLALTLEADYAHSFDLSPARLESGRVGIGYYFFNNFALNAEFGGYSVQQPGPDSVISEIDIKLRHHIFNSGPLSLYIDAGGGVTYATERTPAGGTFYNYTIQTGPGVAWELSDHLFLIGGARYWHLSNARLKGPVHNPSINAIEGYVGLMLTF